MPHRERPDHGVSKVIVAQSQAIASIAFVDTGTFRRRQSGHPASLPQTRHYRHLKLLAQAEGRHRPERNRLCLHRLIQLRP